MKNFNEVFPDDEACITHFKELREKKGIVCKRCQCEKHYWLKKRLLWRCSKCKAPTTLRSGTFMKFSNMSFLTWYTVIYYFTLNCYSANFIQKKLVKHKRYEPIWAMLQKIRKSIAKLNEEIFIESDENRSLHINVFDLGKAMEEDLKGDIQRIAKKTTSRSAISYDFVRECVAETYANPGLKMMKKAAVALKLKVSDFKDLLLDFEQRIRKIYRVIKVDYLLHYINEFLYFNRSKIDEQGRFDEFVLSVSRG